ncbi:sensor domain-containing diguanylate cyclase [Fusibacter sp. 3D3]|uniref:sensor domain-containing diguanylate cyclase n=1 Tax=Fusibacter sp. 3D3 TaxID=1048380 RepID=UPI000853A1F8|nr:sensor domain-containing diguanylate cyclase [Fusibacter sp. 3D3]GAU78506.1 diguanylate cyclase/phosphodiesterase [Fusibacter sp. 3D3]
MFNNGNHELLKDSIERIGAGFAIYEKDSENGKFVLISANKIYENLMKGTVEESLNQEIKKIFPSYNIHEIVKLMNEALESMLSKEIELIYEYKFSTKWWRSIFSPVLIEEGPPSRVINTCIDITEKKILEKQLSEVNNRYEAVVQSAYDGIISVDDEQNIMMINKAACEIFGINSKTAVGSPLTDLIPARFREKHVDYVHHFEKSTITSRPMQERSAITGLRRDGSEVPLEVTISKIYVNGKLEMTAVLRDISEKSSLLEELLILSRTDGLTKLYNRTYFTELFQREIERHARYKKGISIIMFDLDHFKAVNDIYGHGGGDLILTEVSQIIVKNVRRIDSVARWGGEEFIILLPETNVKEAIEISEKLRDILFKHVFIYQELSIKITASFGVASFSEACDTSDKMIKYADDKLYESKTNGRNRVRY